MPLSITDSIKIAQGYDNVDDMVKFDELNPPMFAIYNHDGSILTDWHEAEAYQVNGLGRQENIGLPYDAIIFAPLTPDEFAYLKDLAGPVTMWLYNKYTATWGSYNGTLEMGQDSDRSWNHDQWDKVTVYVRFLKATG